MDIFENEGKNEQMREAIEQIGFFYDNSKNEKRLCRLENEIGKLKELVQKNNGDEKYARKIKELENTLSKLRAEINDLKKRSESPVAEVVDEVKKAYASAAQKLIKQAEELRDKSEKEAEEILGKFGRFRYWIVGAVLSGLCIATGGVWYVARETQTVDIVRVSNELEKARQENRRLEERVMAYEKEIKEKIAESENGLKKGLEEIGERINSKSENIGKKLNGIEGKIEETEERVDKHSKIIEQQGATINELTRASKEDRENYDERLARISGELKGGLNKLETLIENYQRKDDAEKKYNVIRDEIRKQQELLTKYSNTFDRYNKEMSKNYEEMKNRFLELSKKIEEISKKADDSENQIKKIKEKQ